MGLAGVAVLPLLAALVAGTVQVTRCVAVPEGVAQLGIRLALLRHSADCPSTGVALGGEQEQVLGVALVLTLPMLLLHLAAVAGGWGALGALRRSLARLARLRPWRWLPREVSTSIIGPAVPVFRSLTAPRRDIHLRVPLWRGPPATQPA